MKIVSNFPEKKTKVNTQFNRDKVPEWMDAVISS